MLADGGERGAEIDGGRGLADAAFLVGNGQHARPGAVGPGRLRERDDGSGRVASRVGHLCFRFDYSGLPHCKMTNDDIVPSSVTLGTVEASSLQYLAASVNSAATSCPFGNSPTAPLAIRGNA